MAERQQKGLHTGKLIDGRFQVGGLNCQDFLGAFYACEDKQSEEECTIRLWSGAATCAPLLDDDLLHPNIVSTEERSQPGKVPRYAVYESNVRDTLREWLRQNRKAPPKDVLHAVLQLAGAVEAIHSKGITLGYLCPEAVFVGEDFTGDLEVYLPDLRFNITARTLGSKYYSSPSQLEGGKPDIQCDVFALGAILYEGLYSRRAFNGKNAEEILTTVRDKGPLYSKRDGLTGPLVEVLKKALEADSEARFKDVSEFQEALQKALDNLDGDPPFVPAPRASLIPRESAVGAPARSTRPSPKDDPFAAAPPKAHKKTVLGMAAAQPEPKTEKKAEKKPEEKPETTPKDEAPKGVPGQKVAKVTQLGVPPTEMVIPDRRPKAGKFIDETGRERLLDDLSTSEIDLFEMTTGSQRPLANDKATKPKSEEPLFKDPFEKDEKGIQSDAVTMDVDTVDVEVISDGPSVMDRLKEKRKPIAVIVAAVLFLGLVGVILAVFSGRGEKTGASDVKAHPVDGDKEAVKEVAPARKVEEPEGGEQDENAAGESEVEEAKADDDEETERKAPKEVEPERAVESASERRRADGADEPTGRASAAASKGEVAREPASSEPPEEMEKPKPKKTRRRGGWATNPFGD